MFRIVCDPSSGNIELCLAEIRSGSLVFVVCLVGVWQRDFEPVVCAGTNLGLGRLGSCLGAVDLKGRLLSCQSY